jgi:hypothetical protein
LSRVAAEATGRPNLRVADPDLWDRLMALKTLRDDISHAKAEHAGGSVDNSDSIFQRLFDAPLLAYIADVDAAMAHYLD